MSGSRAGFSIQITAVDAATKQIDQINRHIAAMRAPAERLTKSFGKLADNTGITALGTGMRKVSQEAGTAFQNIGRMVAPLSAITGAASIAGLGALATKLGDFGTKTQIAANRAGVGSTQLLNLGNAARLAGSSSEAMTGALTSLKDNIFEIAAGRGAPMTIAAFQKLGVSTRDATTGALRPAADVMADLSTEIAKVKDPTMRATLELATMGGAGADLDPLLKLGAKGMAELTKQAAALYGVTEAQIQASIEFHKKTEGLTIAAEGLGIAIGADLLPVLGPVLKQMTSWITANKDWISADIKGFIEAAIPKIKAFAVGADEMAQSLGGWKTVLEGVVGIALIGWVAGILAALSPLTIALAAILLTIEKINAFKNQSLADLPPGSPLWKDVSDEEQSNYVNSPRSQSFLHPNGGNPNAFSWWNPGSWGGRGAGQQEGSPEHKSLGQQLLDKFSGEKKVNPADPKMLRDYFKSQGWTEQQTAGILANFQGESAMDAGAIGDKGASAGLGQWRDERRLKFMEMYGHDVSKGTPLEQAQFTQWELTNTEKAAGDKLRGTTTAREAGAAFSMAYERPKDVGMNAALRGQYAETWHQKYAGAPSADAPKPAAAAQGPAPGFDASGNPLPKGWMDAEKKAAGTGSQPMTMTIRPQRGRAANANVQGGAGTAPAADSTTTVKGSANVNIKLGGFPPGTRTTAHTDGKLFTGPPRVEQAMAAGGGP